MLRPSHVLAFMTAMLAAEASPTQASVPIGKSSLAAQSTKLTEVLLSEKEQIEYEARRQLGNELSNS